MALSQMSRCSRTFHLVCRRSSLIQQLSASCTQAQTSNKSNSFDVLLNQSLVSKNILYSVEHNSKIALCPSSPPPTTHSHECFQRIKTLDCFKGHLVWDDCLSLGFSWACVTYKSVCNVPTAVQCVRFSPLSDPRYPTRPHFESM